MPVPPGYHGRYLRIDLSTETHEAIPIPGEILRAFLGGSGLGTWILHRESEDRQDPLSPAAPLIFAFSPLVGSPLTTSAKFAVVGQSPLTGRINDSLSSSSFAIAGKKTGFDALVIVGTSSRPTCLVVEPENVEFREARDSWGMMIPSAQKHFAELLPGFRTAVIGPAGENRVRYATISHEGRHAGRGGLGAVMGSKRLKAVAVRGNRLPRFAYPKRLAEFGKELSRRSLGPATAKYRELGTVANLLVFNRLGTLPTRNFQAGTFAEAEALAPETLNQTLPKTRSSCAACTIGCEHIYQLSGDSSGQKPKAVRMEYENLFALGPLCGIGDPEIVLRASVLCDELGLDTISTGATIAFAMECSERGLISAPELKFGNGTALLPLIRDISARRGLGELLAQGTRSAAAEIGQGAADFAPHIKGLELPGYEPRVLPMMALGLAVGTRGADHNRSGAYEVDFSANGDRYALPDAVAAAIATENEAAVMDSLILCKFLRGVFPDRLAGMAEMLELVTGWDVDAQELRETAQRIVSGKKWYNIRQGWTPAEDTLPKRFLSEPLPDGARLSGEKLQTMITLYNSQRGWTAEGWLTADWLEELRRLLSEWGSEVSPRPIFDPVR